MQKVEIFQRGNASEAQKAMNDWFVKNHGKMKITHILKADGVGGFTAFPTILIFYEDSPEEQQSAS